MNLGEFMKVVQYHTGGREELAFKPKHLEFWLLGRKACWFTQCQRIQQKGWFAVSEKLKTEEPEGTVIPSKGKPEMVRKRFCMPASCCPQQRLILKAERWFYQILIQKQAFPLSWNLFSPYNQARVRTPLKYLLVENIMCLMWPFDFSHRQQVFLEGRNLLSCSLLLSSV